MLTDLLCWGLVVAAGESQQEKFKIECEEELNPSSSSSSSSFSVEYVDVVTVEPSWCRGES